MKQNYNQPIVEATEVLAKAVMMVASPGININQDPINDEGGD